MAVPVIAIHGGAITRIIDAKAWRQEIARIIGAGMKLLQDGASALDTVTEAVVMLEDSGLFNAGRGAVANANGVAELDAAVMDGHSLRAGSASVLRSIKNPVRAARLTMEQTPHVMLAGTDAEAALMALGAERIDPATYFRDSEETHDAAPRCDTVGAVALDAAGHLAAATSTGGIRRKLPGRIGDSPVPGAGCFATRYVAVSCTGAGEYFLRVSAASRLAFAMEYGGMNLQDAARESLQAVGRTGGTGGLIAVDTHGNLALPFNGFGMIRGWMHGGDSSASVRLTDV